MLNYEKIQKMLNHEMHERHEKGILEDVGPQIDYKIGHSDLAIGLREGVLMYVDIRNDSLRDECFIGYAEDMEPRKGRKKRKREIM